MDPIVLVEPHLAYAQDLWAFRQEILDVDADHEDQFAGCLSLDTAPSPEAWIDVCLLRRSSSTCLEAGVSVPSHTYFAVREHDHRIVGIIELRHHINHPVLSVWGGHCGYSVRPSERGKGYAKEMLRLNLSNAKALGIPWLLITCSARNEASRRTILANGGVYERTIEAEGALIERYWITL